MELINLSNILILTMLLQFRARLEIDFSIFKVKPAPNIRPVKIDRTGGNPHEIGDLLGGFTLTDQVGHIGFGWGQSTAFD